MSCFVLSNLVVTVGMLTPGLGVSPPRHGSFASLTNRAFSSHRTVVRSHGRWPTSPSTLPLTTRMPTSRPPLLRQARPVLLPRRRRASCSVAVGLNSLVPRLKSLAPATRLILGRLVPFAAVASAGALNVFLMRGEEMRTGIDVFPSSRAPTRRSWRRRARPRARLRVSAGVRRPRRSPWPRRLSAECSTARLSW